MTNFVGAGGCGARSHADDMTTFDELPAELRDRLRRSRTNLCSACIARMAKRDLEATIACLDFERVYRQVQCRTGTYLVREEELRA